MIKKKSKRTVYFHHLGCAKNFVDAQVIAGDMLADSWQVVHSPEEAELIFINSCGFINSAKEESIDAVMQIRAAYPDRVVVLGGCLAQRYGSELQQQLPEVDMVTGNKELSAISEQLNVLYYNKRRQTMIAAPAAAPTPSRLLPFADGRRSAWLKISEGCNHGCSYCAIPLIRGSLVSRSRTEIVAEFRQLIAADIFEVNLIAQDLAAFGMERGQSELAALLNDMLAAGGDYWLRLLYIHPDHFPEQLLIELCLRDKRLLPYFDIPFQHADAALLRRMGRAGSISAYLRLVERIRAKLPAAIIRSTFLVGFDGEDQDSFAVLRDFQDKAQLDWLGVFCYSPEEETRAMAERQDGMAVSAATAEKRRRQLMLRQQSISHRRLRRFIGQKLAVIIEETISGGGYSIGRGYMQAPEVDGNVVIGSDRLQPGDVVNVVISEVNGIDLYGTVV